MASNSLVSAYGRAYIGWEDGLTVYVYYGDIKVDGAQRSAGTLTPVLQNGVVIASAKAPPNLWSAQMTGRAYRGETSILRQAYDSGRTLNVQIHYGTCNDPVDFADYEDALLFESCAVTDYTTTNLAASAPGENAMIQETFTLSFVSQRWLHKPKLTQAEATITTSAAVLALALSDVTSGTPGHPIRRIYALLEAPFTSGFTAHFSLAWSDDKGATWATTTLNNGGLLGPGPAKVCRIEVLDGFVIGMNNLHIWAIDPALLVAGGNITPSFLNARNSGATSVDIKRYKEQVFVMFADGTMTAVNKDLTTEAFPFVTTTDADVFTFIENDHALIATYHFLGSSELYEVYGGLKRRVLTNLDSGYRAPVLYTAPSGITFVSTVTGKVYYRLPISDDFTEVADLLTNDCISHFHFVDNALGYMVGRYVWRTVDGGLTWEKLDDTSWTPDTYWFVAVAAEAGTLVIGGSNTAAGNPQGCNGYINAYGGAAGILACAI